MISIWRAKFWLGTFLATIFVIVSQEVKILPSPFPTWMIAIIAFILSTYASSLFIKVALSTKRGRRMIMGKSWIEGYWYLQTFIDENHPHPITNDGITSILYEGTEFELSVFTYRRRTGVLATGFSSVSELTMAREYDTRFSNYFTITEGLKESKGISVGKFYRDQNTKHPNRYEGTVVLFSDGIYRRQVGHKIPDEIVTFLRRSNGERWMDALLDLGYEHLLELIGNKGNDVLGQPKHEQKKSREQRVTVESRRRYIFALLFASIFTASTTALFIIYKNFTPGDVNSLPLSSEALIWVTLFTSIVSAISTFSAIILAWRSDRRDAREKELKIAQLERELAASSEKPTLPISEGNKK